MIDELIFNNQRFLSQGRAKYIGKKLKLGKHENLNYYMEDGEDGKLVPYHYADDTYFEYSTVIGQREDANHKIYVLTYDDRKQIWFKIDEFFANGGVLGSHLANLYQAFKRAFTRNEVIAWL